MSSKGPGEVHGHIWKSLPCDQCTLAPKSCPLGEVSSSSMVIMMLGPTFGLIYGFKALGVPNMNQEVEVALPETHRSLGKCCGSLLAMCVCVCVCACVCVCVYIFM